MHSLQRIHDVVLRFAATHTAVKSPAAIAAAIDPLPARMPDDEYERFYFDLLAALEREGVRTRLPFGGVREATKWLHVSMLAAEFEEAA